MDECHRRDLKVIMDMVLNHTSTEHPWFKEALTDKDSPYRDYYIIRKGRFEKGKMLPPTNWASTFTGSAWERIGDTDEYYLHLFCKEQADLNWENEEVRDEIIDILNFWLDMGVDGFRFDVFNMFSKVYPIRDDDSKKTFQKGAKFFIDGPRMHEFLREMNERSLSLYDSFTVGESYHPSNENALEYVRAKNHELDSIFNFGHLDSDNISRFFYKPFNLRQFKEGLLGPQMAVRGIGWNTLVLENHDNPRSVSRFSIDTRHYRYEAATMLAVVTYMGFGTPFIYMGQEIGMTNCRFDSIDQMKDPVSHFVYDLLRKYGMPSRLAFRLIRSAARDHSRIPMAWDDTVNGGFNKGHTPWQCADASCKEINVQKDLNSDKSIYRFYQKLLQIRKENDAALYGKTIEVDHKNKKIIAYYRAYKGKRLFIAANFSDKKVRYTLPGRVRGAKLLISNYDELAQHKDYVILRPYQAVVFEGISSGSLSS